MPPRQITVVGASQGSWIAMLASTYLRNRDLKLYFIAGCSADPEFLKLIDWHGNVLSIYENSDARVRVSSITPTQPELTNM